MVPIIAARLDSEGLTPVWETLERPLVPVLVAMEQAGVRVDTAILRTQSEQFERELDGLSRRIFDLSGLEFNIGSPKQLGEVLFEKLQLPTLKRTGNAGGLHGRRGAGGAGAVAPAAAPGAGMAKPAETEGHLHLG